MRVHSAHSSAHGLRTHERCTAMAQIAPSRIPAPVASGRGVTSSRGAGTGARAVRRLRQNLEKIILIQATTRPDGRAHHTTHDMKKGRVGMWQADDHGHGRACIPGRGGARVSK